MARKDFDNGGWDWNQIYTGPASDDHGHKASPRVAYPDSWMAAISILIQPGNEWPEYDSVAAFIRDAVFARMQWAAQQAERSVDARVKSLMQLEANEARLNYMAVMRARVLAHLEKMDKVFRDAMADGDRKGVSKIIHEFEESLDTFPQPYYDQVRDKLEMWKRKAQGH